MLIFFFVRTEILLDSIAQIIVDNAAIKMLKITKANPLRQPFPSVILLFLSIQKNPKGASLTSYMMRNLILAFSYIPDSSKLHNTSPLTNIRMPN